MNSAAKISARKNKSGNICYHTEITMEELFEMPLFSTFYPGSASEILDRHPGRFNRYAKGDIIAMQGYACRALYLLGSGSVYAKMISEEGKEFTLDTLSDGIFPVTIIASTDCGIWTIGRDTLAMLLEQDKAILSNYLKIISDHSMFLSRRLHEFALQTLASRITSYIERNGPIENLREVAFILGVARPSLSRTISQLVAKGVLERSGNTYRLH